MRVERAEDAAEGGGRALCATGVDADEVVAFIIFFCRTRNAFRACFVKNRLTKHVSLTVLDLAAVAETLARCRVVGERTLRPNETGNQQTTLLTSSNRRMSCTSRMFNHTRSG